MTLHWNHEYSIAFTNVIYGLFGWSLINIELVQTRLQKPEQEIWIDGKSPRSGKVEDF